MEQLPKIVRQRLQTSGQMQDHIDPNLLAAFAENVLAERERALVQTHLAQCGECREVAALAAPELEIEMERVAAVAAASAAPIAGRSLWGKFNLSWGLFAACVSVAVGIFSFQVLEKKRMAEVAQNNLRQGETSMAATKVAPEMPPASESASSDTNLVAQAEPPPVAEEKLKSSRADKAASRPNVEMLDKSMARAKVMPELAMPKRAASGSVGVPARILKPESAGSFGITTETASGAVSEDQLQPIQKRQERADAAKSSNQAVFVNAAPAAPPIQNKTDVAQEKQDKKMAAAEAAPAHAGAVVTGGSFGSRLSLKDEAAIMQKTQARAQDRLAANYIQPRWNLSSDGGTLLRSFDEGRTWDMVPVAKNVVLHAVAAFGPDVWAGGPAGALYHSTDQGQHWTHIKPVADGVVLTADVAKIELNDQHCQVTTTAGDVWTSSDDGHTWQNTR